MANHLQKITTRAKQIHRAHPKKKWTDCIKQASKELKRGGKIGTAKTANRSRQTGRSNKKRDEERSAQTPGKRLVKSASGESHVYYERRKNRSDAPGKLSGVSTAKMKSVLRNRLQEKLGKDFVQKTFAKTKRAKQKIQKDITSTIREIKKLK
jgi:hypothetical protein